MESRKRTVPQTAKNLRVKRLRRVSLKRALQLPQLRKLVKKKLEECPWCERCFDKATCVHHWAGRRWNLLKYEYLRSSCWKCNQFAREHPQEAILEGWRAPIGVYAA